VKYARFELLTIGVGGIAVLGTVVMALQPQPDVIELIAQLLLLAVLIGAVHWGRNGGMIAALVAIIAYILMRVPFVTDSGISADVFRLILVRMGTYGLIGIVGGEICGRIQYFFVRLGDSMAIDEDSGVYNQRFVAQLLRNSVSSFERYGAPFSVVVLALAPALTEELRPGKVSVLVRTVADGIRNDLRLVDEVGHLDDGRFLLVLPHTPKDGAQVAAARVRTGVRDTVGAKDGSVTAQVMGAAEDSDAIHALLDSIAPPTVVPAE
jgi:GGDEF domain-containing protein